MPSSLYLGQSRVLVCARARRAVDWTDVTDEAGLACNGTGSRSRRPVWEAVCVVCVCEVGAWVPCLCFGGCLLALVPLVGSGWWRVSGGAIYEHQVPSTPIATTVWRLQDRVFPQPEAYPQGQPAGDDQGRDPL
jgi:hypothetical protein